jgi:UDP-N-acetylmuramyl pentapeptide phosphotransferase/UDP-N-acetylglucosamine-1-phosphate transferase
MQNNSWIGFAIAFSVLLIAELFYFKIAFRFNIMDKPNERSSHKLPIIRGGGIVFLFGVLIWFIQNDFQWPWFVTAAILIAIVSFLDDITSLHPGVRFVVHLSAMLLVLFQLWPIYWPFYLLVAAVIVCIGTLNAFNFMDGINGITGTYALITLVSFACVDQWIVHFTDLNLLITVMIAVIIFLFFNFRKVASCFAGDVGSVTIALILIFILLQLINATHNFLWPLVFLVYGTDSIVTIISRLRRKENIFKAHRTHLYQYLSNELRMPHLTVSVGYAIVQGLINLIVIVNLNDGNYFVPILVSVAFVVFYLFLRRKIVKEVSRQRV